MNLPLDPTKSKIDMDKSIVRHKENRLGEITK